MGKGLVIMSKHSRDILAMGSYYEEISDHACGINVVEMQALHDELGMLLTMHRGGC